MSLLGAGGHSEGASVTVDDGLASTIGNGGLYCRRLRFGGLLAAKAGLGGTSSSLDLLVRDSLRDDVLEELKVVLVRDGVGWRWC